MAITVPRYTVEDLEHFPDDGNRYELLDGALLVTPAPNPPHQAIAARILGMLTLAGVFPQLAAVFTPGAISVPPRTQLEPDVLVVPAAFENVTRWTEVTEHWLAVEILSRSSRIYDREFKRNAYFGLGVREVWLIDMKERAVEVCKAPGPGVFERKTFTWHVPASAVTVAVDVTALFAPLS